MNIHIKLKAAIGCAVLALGSQSAMANFVGGIPAGWVCTGTCGTTGADGSVTLSPLSNSQYGYVTTNGGVLGVAPPALSPATPTDGSTLVSTSFHSNAGDALNFYFNYVTSDGTGYPDTAWARLLNASDNSQAALLFTARTDPSVNTIPGVDMPPSDATLTPSTVMVTGSYPDKGPKWSPLGSDSGLCWETGCGYTGWVLSSYSIPNAGNYLLEFGVVNANDQIYNSGLAFDGITIAGKPIEDNPGTVPLPAALPLMLSGLGVLSFASRRRKNTAV